MKVVFISNYINHHQMPVAEELYARLGGDYNFISTDPLPDNFIKNGYPNCSNRPFHIAAYGGESQLAEAKQHIAEADIVVFGDNRHHDLWECRLRTGKITFDYSERWIRSLKTYLKMPWRYINGSVLKTYLSRRGRPLFLLCSGAHVADDFLLFGRAYRQKYKWGYITDSPEFDIEAKLSALSTNSHIRLLWCGRFLYCKHPMLVIKMARRLKELGHSFWVDMYGSAENTDPTSVKYYSECVAAVAQYGLEDTVFFQGNLPNKDILIEMRKSDIFIFSSDRGEGWGAVLNEAMSQGCAVVASNEPGSVPYLLGDSEYGLVFRNNNLNDLVRKTNMLMHDRALRQDYARKAYNRMNNDWSPGHAAENLLKLFEVILAGRTDAGIPPGEPGSVAKYRFFR